MLSGMRALNPQEVAYMQASVEDIYTRFTEIVSNGRGMTVEAVDNIAQGRVWTGAEALGIGLVDEIGTLEDAIKYAVTDVNLKGLKSLVIKRPAKSAMETTKRVLIKKSSLCKNYLKKAAKYRFFQQE